MLKLLFVDDETDIRDLVEIALMVEPDLDVQFAASGAEAITVLGEAHFDIIMLDVMMPPPDGLEVLRVARQRSALDGATIVMCTAKTSPEAEVEFRALGADHILHKPFKPLQLAKYLRALNGRERTV